jgi:hypothetical protein
VLIFLNSLFFNFSKKFGKEFLEKTTGIVFVIAFFDRLTPSEISLSILFIL